MSLPAAVPVSHRSVLTIAVPIMLSNVSEPLIGVVNTIVVGQLPDPAYIGAVAVGAAIFSLIFWGFGSLRLATGGLSAQAVGAGDPEELVAILGRALIIAIVAGLALVVAAPFIADVAFTLVGGSPDLRVHGEVYFSYRIWSAPFALANYCLMGWLIGQARAGWAFLVQLFLNCGNMALSALFVLVLGMTVDGVGLAALISEVAAAVLALAIALVLMGQMGLRFDRARILRDGALWRTLAMNGDVMVRSLCLVFAFTWFTSRGARAGDIVVAANAVLLNFFEVAAFLIDGFAYASEAMVGQAAGARDRPRFRAAIWLTSVWAMVVGVICSFFIWLAGPVFIDLMTVNPEVREVARDYLPWVVISPVLGVVCFQFDGIFTGAMATRDMRNMMILSLAAYLAAWWLLEARFGNHGLWAALNFFFIVRGLTFASRLPAVERRLFG